jgi:hypothetical protein
MIFAEMEYAKEYAKLYGDLVEFHTELVEFIKSEFSDIKYGLQSDSWIWIFDGSTKVAIDTFSSMKHQVKCDSAGSLLLKKVIESLSAKYVLNVYSEPELEAHEE